MSQPSLIGLRDAQACVQEHMQPSLGRDVAIEEAGGLALAEDCVSRVDCPAAATSLKDGYAVVSSDLDRASAAEPVRLKLVGTLVAGGASTCEIRKGHAVKIMTGARLPKGATGVIACEYTHEEDAFVICRRDAQAGRNVLSQGHDVAKGHIVARSGDRLKPAKTGLLAAAGLDSVRVFPRPRVGLIGTGDELALPGQRLSAGQLYASNLVTLRAWLKQFNMTSEMAIVPDQQDALVRGIEQAMEHNDVLITSGGAWTSDRDLTVRTVTDMGGRCLFHGIRLGPGKAIAFCVLKDKAVFCLPGGPPSNEMSFLQVVLPGLLQRAGLAPQPFHGQPARLMQSVQGQIDWTQFLYAHLYQDAGHWCVVPRKKRSRLQSQAEANALIEISEGKECLGQGERIDVQVLSPLRPSPDRGLTDASDAHV